MKSALFTRSLTGLFSVCLFFSLSAIADEKGQIEAWLDAHELLAGNELLISWTERSTTTADTYVWGCRLEPLDGEMQFDVYFDGEGMLLYEHDLRALGITVKQWEYMDVSLPAVVSSNPVVEKPQVLPFRKGVNTPAILLESLDHEFLIEEDRLREEGASNSLMRYGVNRFLENPLIFSGRSSSAGNLDIEPDGSWQWEGRIQSTDALGLRIYFEEIDLPEGVEVFVYNTQTPSEFYGPVDSGHGVWSPSVINDTLGIICRGTSSSLLDTVSFKIDRLIHIYRSPIAERKEVGDCHIDVACRPEWEGHASAVGRLGLIDFDAWACTGALIVASGYTDNPPFLLTANHCVSIQAQATTLEIWWLYQRATCEDELPPDMGSLPRSVGGATLLASSSATDGTDFTLLLLGEPVPVTTAFLGYSTQLIETGESVVCIHHPQGTEKRISFGLPVNSGSPRLDGEPLASRDYFHEVLWQEGTTEGGSSGSPLLRADTGQIVGQLYGGYASCVDTDEPDYFGRMDVTYALIDPWLSGEYAIEGESEDEGEGEVTEGEGEGVEGEVTEGEIEGEREAPATDCFFGLIPCPVTEPGATLFRYAETAFKVILSVLGLLLARYLLTRSRT